MGAALLNARWCTTGVDRGRERSRPLSTLPSSACKSACFTSGAGGIRTPDLRRAKAALSQLSYGPGMEGEFTCEGCVIQRAPGTLGGYKTVCCMLARGEVDRVGLSEYKCAGWGGRFDLMRSMGAPDDPGECPGGGSVEAPPVSS